MILVVVIVKLERQAGIASMCISITNEISSSLIFIWIRMGFKNGSNAIITMTNPDRHSPPECLPLCSQSRSECRRLGPSGLRDTSCLA